MRADTGMRAWWFAGPLICFDQQFGEIPVWRDIKTWADSMGWKRVLLARGVGRQRLGNDVFSRVRDRDGHPVKSPSAIEECALDRLASGPTRSTG
jgi:hypothetical protein